VELQVRNAAESRWSPLPPVLFRPPRLFHLDLGRLPQYAHAGMATLSAGASRWIGVLFAVIGLGMLGGSYWTAQERLAIVREWPATEGEVLSSEITRHRGDDSTTYGVEIEFRYTVAGQERRAPATRGFTTSSFSSMQKTVDRFPPGSRHPIKYNPASPGEIYFNAGYTLEFFGIPAFLAGMGLIFTLVGGGITLGKRHPYAPAADQCPNCRAPAPPDNPQFCPKCGAQLREP